MPKYTFQQVNPQQWDNAIWMDPKKREKTGDLKPEKTKDWIEKAELKSRSFEMKKRQIFIENRRAGD